MNITKIIKKIILNKWVLFFIFSLILLQIYYVAENYDNLKIIPKIPDRVYINNDIPVDTTDADAMLI